MHDTMDISGGTSQDCNANGTPDSCEGADCNANGRLDACDIAGGTSQDCDLNNVPDSCQPDCNVDGTPIVCEADCNANGLADDCELTAGTSLDCNANGTPDECDPGSYCLGTYTPCGADDCNFNGIRDAYDIDSGVSQDSNVNGTPDECDLPARPLVCASRVVSWKDHANHDPPGAPEDEYIEINRAGRIQVGPITSEPRRRAQGISEGGIAELRIMLDAVPPWPVSNPVSLFEQNRQSCGASCPGGTQPGYQAYAGASVMTATLQGTTLTLSFSPVLEDVKTYKFRLNTSLTRAPQTFEVRCLIADVNSSGVVNAIDRSLVIGVWTGSGYSPETDINLDGVTNAIDRSIVIGVWTDPSGRNCAP